MARVSNGRLVGCLGSAFCVCDDGHGVVLPGVGQWLHRTTGYLEQRYDRMTAGWCPALSRDTSRSCCRCCCTRVRSPFAGCLVLILSFGSWWRPLAFGQWLRHFGGSGGGRQRHHQRRWPFGGWRGRASARSESAWERFDFRGVVHPGAGKARNSLLTRSIKTGLRSRCLGPPC